MAAVDTTVDLPKGTDLVNAIKLENEKQELGLFEGKLKVPVENKGCIIFMHVQ
jgi:hypothetical protein